VPVVAAEPEDKIKIISVPAELTDVNCGKM
jgi:hypothetical protein